MNKKLFLFLACLIFAGAVNAFEISDKDTDAKVAAALEAAKEEAEAQPAPYYGYKPIVFELRSTYSRKLSKQMEDFNLRYAGMDQPYSKPISASSKVTEKCYATVVSKNWLITEKRCLYIPVSAQYKAQGGFTYILKTMTFYRNGYKTVIDNPSKIKYYEDKQTGAVLINIPSTCMEHTPKERAGICLDLWELLIGADETPFRVQENYSSIILTDVVPWDSNNKNFKLAFGKRAFFTPLLKDKAITVQDVQGMYLKLPKDLLEEGKPLAGEILFHKNAVNEQIIVAINTASGTRNYKLFGKGFTALIKKLTAQNRPSVILTKDLNANAKL